MSARDVEAASEYFAKPITPADVVHSYAGVRALIDDGSGKPEVASRGYHLPVSEADPPLLQRLRPRLDLRRRHEVHGRRRLEEGDAAGLRETVTSSAGILQNRMPRAIAAC